MRNLHPLIGSNKDEARFVSLYPASPFFGHEKTTARQFTDAAVRRFGSSADAFLELYPAGSSDDAARASQRMAFRDEAAWNANGLVHSGRRAATRTSTTSSMNPRRHPASRIAERHTALKFRMS